jgi:SAM-dependent methyltransferase
MRLDLVVHRLPRFYQWKLDVISYIKRALYRVLLMDRKIDLQRKAIQDRNNKLIAKYVAGKSVLEIGCGRGSLLGTLAKDLQCKCVGVDLSLEMINYARKNNPGPVYQVMDSSDLSFSDRQFDVVLFNYVLHHVKDLDRTIAEAKRVGKTIIFYESCAWEGQPFKTISRLYWKITDGGYEYLTLNEWKRRFQLQVLDEIKGSSFIRYGMCVLRVDGVPILRTKKQRA